MDTGQPNVRGTGTTGAAAVVMVQAVVALREPMSVTVAVKTLGPVPVGVPTMAPVEVFRVKPAGSGPARENVYGAVPPAASRAEVYGTETWAVTSGHPRVTGTGITGAAAVVMVQVEVVV